MLRGEYNIKNISEMSCNSGERDKKLIPCFWGKARQRATQATPPPPCVMPRFGDSPMWGNAKLVRQTPKWVARMRRQSGGGGGVGQFCHFSNNSTMKQYFKMLISHEDVYSFPSPYCSVKVCLSPFYVL